MEAEHALDEPPVVRLRRARVKPELQPLDGKLVRLLRRKGQQQSLT